MISIKTGEVEKNSIFSVETAIKFGLIALLLALVPSLLAYKLLLSYISIFLGHRVVQADYGAMMQAFFTGWLLLSLLIFTLECVGTVVVRVFLRKAGRY